ncbi:Nuclease precursor [Flavobacterium columnare]|uniref:Endonuclease n=2 Tax=Flavobacterium TaxID=237 RepID=A0A2N9P9D4_9FLAO|nr:DNA/RNA non-specific endonuclease [Flavobacterium columnare]RVU89763.1 DNA/RNA non-specific endonuclease [Flavobacterium columnare]SPE76982.1 Nuclease precursor [Flavobacterium columnare]
MKKIKRLTCLILACQTLVFCSRDNETDSSSVEVKAENQRKIVKASSVDNGDMMLGNPSKANQEDYNNYLLGKENYTLSYNNKKGTPNWTSWHLDYRNLGSTSRANDFRADTGLNGSFFLVSPTHYKDSGFDRGHMCPSADRTNTFQANSETFLMTNMVPQSPKNNQQTWEGLEERLRQFVRNDDKEVYIIAGPYGQGGTGKNGGVTKFLANGKICVPSSTWKIAVILDEGNDDLTRIDENTTIIAIDVPNNQNIDRDWKKYIVKVSDIEQKTGFSFFSSMTSTLAKKLKAKTYSGK